MNKEECLLENYKDTYDYCRRLQRGGLSEFPPMIVTCAITGSNAGKEINPNLPESLDEQVEQAYGAYKAGAAVVHIHRRDPKNPCTVTTDYQDYIEVNRRIREKCPDLIINNTVAGGRNRTSDTTLMEEQKSTAVLAKPEIGSLDTTNYSIYMKLPARNPPLFGRDETVFKELTHSMSVKDCQTMIDRFKENGIKPEFEIFDVGDIMYLNNLIKAGFAEDGPHLISFMSTAWASFPTMQYLQNVINCTPKNCILSVGAIGAIQFPFLAMCIAQGLHVRVGMEDNVYLERGKLAESNAQLVEKIVSIARLMGRRIATPQETREMLSLGEPRMY